MGNVFLVCPHHKVLTTALVSIRSWRAPSPCMQALTTAPLPPLSPQLLDLIRSWRAPNLSTLQGMAPVHASKAARRGLRLDHLFNQRDGPQGAIARLETDLADYWGALAHQKLSEATLLELARSNTKIQVRSPLISFDLP